MFVLRHLPVPGLLGLGNASPQTHYETAISLSYVPGCVSGTWTWVPAGELELSEERLKTDGPSVRDDLNATREWTSDFELELEKLDAPRHDH